MHFRSFLISKNVVTTLENVCVQEPEAEDFGPTRPPRRGEAPRSEGVTRRQTQSWQETGEYRRYLESLSHSTYDQMNRDLTRKVGTEYKASIDPFKRFLLSDKILEKCTTKQQDIHHRHCQVQILRDSKNFHLSRQHS